MLAALGAQALPPGVVAEQLLEARAIEAGSRGSKNTARSPAISRSGAMSEQATGTPRIIASSTGSPNPSTSDGSATHAAPA